MYDLHNHILPGVDDGARSLEVALRMLEMAVRQGVTHIACTPHSNDRLDEARDRLFQSVFSQVKDAAKAASLPVELALGSELMVGSDILRVLSFPTATYQGQGQYALIEFPWETPFEIIQNVVVSIRRRGVWPVLAHFERFSRAQRAPEQPGALRKLGAVITLDAGALTGQFGTPLQKRARQLLAWDCVDVLASDAHNTEEHGCRMSEGKDASMAALGPGRAMQLVTDNPRRIWEGQPWNAGETATGGNGAG